jgi:hypothetical protein
MCVLCGWLHHCLAGPAYPWDPGLRRASTEPASGHASIQAIGSFNWHRAANAGRAAPHKHLLGRPAMTVVAQQPTRQGWGLQPRTLRVQGRTAAQAGPALAPRASSSGSGGGAQRRRQRQQRGLEAAAPAAQPRSSPFLDVVPGSKQQQASAGGLACGELVCVGYSSPAVVHRLRPLDPFSAHLLPTLHPSCVCAGLPPRGAIIKQQQ